MQHETPQFLALASTYEPPLKACSTLYVTCVKVDCYINCLPVELMEILLIRAAVFMLIGLNKMTSRGCDVIALTSLQGVCKLWYRVFIHRRWNQRQLRRSFNGM